MGKFGEQTALGHLQLKGMRLIERNWRCHLGEIDLIMLDEDVVVFIEVKTRKNWRFVHRSLALSLSQEKRKRLKRLSESYLRMRYRRPRQLRCRIDFVGVIVDRAGLVSSISHYRAAIE